MKQSIYKRILCILSCLLLAAITGCKENQDKVTAAKDSNPTKYYASFQQISVSEEKSYLISSEIKGRMLYAIIGTIDEQTNETSKITLHKINLDTGEDAITELKDKNNTNAEIYSFCFNEDDTIALFESITDTEQNTSTYKISYLDKNGSETSGFTLTDAIENAEGQYPHGAYFDKNGSLYVALGNNVYYFAKDGALVNSITIPGNPLDLSMSDNGELYMTFIENGSKGSVTKKLNFDDKSMSGDIKGLEISGNILNTSDGLICFTTQGAFKYNTDTKETTQLWDWLSLGIKNCSSEIVPVDENKYVLISSDNSSESDACTINFVTISTKPNDNVTINAAVSVGSGNTDENAQEITTTTIVLGCETLDFLLSDIIYEFNKVHPECEIKVEQYSTDGMMYDVEGQARFDADVALGNKMDIIAMNKPNYVKYASKGVFADIGKFMDEDPDINRSDFFENILDTFKVNGKDYTLTPYFSIITQFGSKTEFEGKTNVTLDEILELRKKNPDIPFIEYPIKDEALYEFLYSSLDEYVNKETKECFFNTDKFINTLELANTFYDYYDMETYNSYEEIRQGHVLLIPWAYLFDFSNLYVYNELFPEGYEIIGKPVNEGSGSFATTALCFAISEQSSNKELCWEFLKYMLQSESYRSISQSYGFPTYKPAYDSFVEKSMEYTTKTNTNGQEIEESIRKAGNGFEEIDVFAPRQNDIDTVNEIIKNIDKSVLYADDNIYNIIAEEASLFFSGSKTAAEVADIIQNRVTLYLSEID